MKIAYFGTPDFSAVFLEKVLKDKEIPVEISLVVTQPDKKVGKKKIVTPSPVKVMAQKNNIPVISSLKDEKSADGKQISHSVRDDLKGIDLAVLFAYGKILPKELLDAPRHGFWNIHPSLLPKYRGAAPVASPLINGDTETGVTLMKMDEELDHGPIIGQKKLEINPVERRPELTARLTSLAFALFKEEILKFPNNKLTEQDHSQATFTKILSRNDGLVTTEQLKNSPEKVFNLFRGLYPWPGVWTKVMVNGQEKRLKLTDLALEKGEVVIKKVQLEGKNEVDFTQFNSAYTIIDWK